MKMRTFRAPGRVNLIGEHTDYNDGFVMPAAIGFSTYVSITPRNDRKLLVFSQNFSEEVEFDLDERSPDPLAHWSDYVRGVAVTLQRSGYEVSGATLQVRGEVPIGSGLSSSAAIEVASAKALLSVSQAEVDPVTLAKLCQLAENEFVGMRCGIMDQFVSCMGQASKALLLDCRSLEYKFVPITEGLRLVICNTMVKHELADSEYNLRRKECAAGVEMLRKKIDGVSALRDVSESELQRHKNDLPELIYRRCRHVVTEDARVLAAASALGQNDFVAVGELMNESHNSLRDDFEVSCAELDLMVHLAGTVDGVFGSRMTGGGFGGCTVNLVKAEAIEALKSVVSKGYVEATGIKPQIYVCQAVNGAEEVTDH
jgi:galactokinase